MVVNKPGGNPEHNKDIMSKEVLFQEQERNKNALRSGPPPHKGAIFHVLSNEVHHSKWQLTKYFTYNVEIFHLYAEMGNNDHPAMHLRFLDALNLSQFVTAPNHSQTGRDIQYGNDT